MIDIHEAQSILYHYACAHSLINTQEHIETIPLHTYSANALGRILAVDVASPIDVPEFDNSAMDGYAVHTDAFTTGSRSLPISLVVSDTVSAGSKPSDLKPHTCVRIFTGAAIPHGANTVVPLEQCHYDAERNEVQFPPPFPKVGAHIRARQLNFAKGDIVLRKGTMLGVNELTLLGSIGIVSLSVVRVLKVGLCITGDELVNPGTPLDFGKIYNSNAIFLYNILRAHNCEVVQLRQLADDYKETAHAIRTLSETCDIIITSGGISVGEKDYIYTFIVQEITDKNKIFIRKVAVKPGKPFTCAEYNGCPIVALPGNPLSVFITYLWFVRPFLHVLQGSHYTFSQISMNHTDNIMSVPAIQSMLLTASPRRFEAYPRTQFIFASMDRATMHVVPLQDQSSAALKNIYMANGALIIPQHTEVEEGDMLLFWEWGNYGIAYDSTRHSETVS